MKKFFSVFLVCVALQVALAQASAEPVEQGSDRLGLTLGATVTLSDVTDKVMPGIRINFVDKTIKRWEDCNFTEMSMTRFS
jgi:hypothetical protein